MESGKEPERNFQPQSALGYSRNEHGLNAVLLSAHEKDNFNDVFHLHPSLFMKIDKDNYCDELVEEENVPVPKRSRSSQNYLPVGRQEENVQDSMLQDSQKHHIVIEELADISLGAS